MARNTTTTARKATTTAKGKAAPRTRKAPAQAQGKAAQAAPAKPVAVHPKCARGRVGKAKPQAKMLRVIATIGKHPGTALRKKRWPNYEVGFTLHHCAVTEGLDHKDVIFWTQHTGTDGKPLMVLREPTADELKANDAAWAEQQGESAAS